MKNKMTDVRNILIEQMELLNDPEAEVNMDRVKAINEIGKTLVESAKAEASFLKVAYRSGVSKNEHSGFVKTSNELTE